MIIVCIIINVVVTGYCIHILDNGGSKNEKEKF